MSRIEQGPLKIEILPEFCFTALESLLDSSRQLQIRYLFIDTEKHFSQKLTDIEHAHLFQSPDGSTYKLTQEENKKVGIKFVRFSTQNKTQIFIPRFASEPIDRHLELDVASPYRLYDLEKLKSTNNIFLTQTKAGTVRLGYGKSNQWKFEEYNNQAILLPWMGFQLVLLKYWKDTALRWLYVEGEPNKEESKNIKALVAIVTKGKKSEELLFTDQNQTQSQISNLQGFIRKQLVFLPFQMELVRFKMDKIPGTDKPASFESFVKLKDTGETAHIYMNNPLKRGGYTFYQASYFQDEKGAYHSVLSVNRDPGRFIKYFGSAFLVIGMILTFLILYGYWKVT
ncbi:MAG: cytochrome c biogenesis protein ResB [Deltaproteobacteria bacterium]|nr:cytochrome c biogenesis protein ResB [Deltaproteobacteria bacterium]